MKLKSLAMGMILPLAASVALATAPAASASTPTKATFTQSAQTGVSTDYGWRPDYRCSWYHGYWGYEGNRCRLWHNAWWWGDYDGYSDYYGSGYYNYGYPYYGSYYNWPYYGSYYNYYPRHYGSWGRGEHHGGGGGDD